MYAQAGGTQAENTAGGAVAFLGGVFLSAQPISWGGIIIASPTTKYFRAWLDKKGLVAVRNEKLRLISLQPQSKGQGFLDGSIRNVQNIN